MANSMQAQAFGAGIGNNAANLNTQRGMIAQAQQNAANNTANQLAALTSRANNTANAINSAMSSAAGLYR